MLKLLAKIIGYLIAYNALTSTYDMNAIARDYGNWMWWFAVWGVWSLVDTLVDLLGWAIKGAASEV